MRTGKPQTENEKQRRGEGSMKNIIILDVIGAKVQSINVRLGVIVVVSGEIWLIQTKGIVIPSALKLACR